MLENKGEGEMEGGRRSRLPIWTHLGFQSVSLKGGKRNGEGEKASSSSSSSSAFPLKSKEVREGGDLSRMRK